MPSTALTGLEAKYAVETDSGERIYVTNFGVRSGSAEDIAVLVRGEQVPGERIYFRSRAFWPTGRSVVSLEHDSIRKLSLPSWAGPGQRSWDPASGDPYFPDAGLVVSGKNPSRSAVRQPSIVDVLLLAVAVAWGSTYWVAKELVSPDTVLAVLGVRMVLTALALGLILLVMRNRLKRAELVIGGVLGLLLSTVFTFETFGIAATSATNAGLIISLTIVMTPVLETLTGKRKLSGLFYLAAMIAVAGVYFLATGGAAASFGTGDLLILLAAVARAFHVTGMHRLSAGRSLDSLNLTFVQMAICGLAFLALSSFWGTPITSYAGSMGGAAKLQMAYLVIVCTVFPFFIQMWAVRKTSPTRVSLLLGTEPVWAAFIGVTLAGDVLGPIGIAGVVLVLAGTMWGQRLELRTPRTALQADPAPGEVRTPTAGVP